MTQTPKTPKRQFDTKGLKGRTFGDPDLNYRDRDKLRRWWRNYNARLLKYIRFFSVASRWNRADWGYLWELYTRLYHQMGRGMVGPVPWYYWKLPREYGREVRIPLYSIDIRIPAACVICAYEIRMYQLMGWPVPDEVIERHRQKYIAWSDIRHGYKTRSELLEFYFRLTRRRREGTLKPWMLRYAKTQFKNRTGWYWGKRKNFPAHFRAFKGSKPLPAHERRRRERLRRKPKKKIIKPSIGWLTEYRRKFDQGELP